MKITGNKLYQRVAASIADGIEAGRWSPGTRLPGERDLAEEYKVSRPTIREAMIALEMKGWIEARHGSGLYVTKRDHGSGRFISPASARAPASGSTWRRISVGCETPARWSIAAAPGGSP